MISKQLLEDIIESQHARWEQKAPGIKRDALSAVKPVQGFARVITGIRRCGKSTLMHQMMSENKEENCLYLNFEDPRLVGFDTNDYRKLDAVFSRTQVRSLYLDEIQMMPGWELYARQKLDEGFLVTVTGSNATLLSKELGTKLTGRHLRTELFPFSYSEFLKMKELTHHADSALSYLHEGGFPEYVKTGDAAILQTLLDDILARNIAVRHGIRDIRALRMLAVYLISNIGKPVSATNLSKLFELKAVSTMLEYFSFLKDAYLLQFVPKFSYSLKKQIRNPKKVYCIDMGMFTHTSTVFSDEAGHRLENVIFLHFRSQGMTLNYFHEKKECDFIVMQHGKIKEAVQVCYELHDDNTAREIAGLTEAMTALQLTEGTIVTLNQTDHYTVNGTEIRVIPLHELVLSS